MFQDSDLKQYLDHCGNLMSMHNVKVRASTHLGAHLFSSPGREPKVLAAEVVQTFKCRREGRGSAIQGGPERGAPRPAPPCPTDTHALPLSSSGCKTPLSNSEHQFPMCQMDAGYQPG